LRKIHKSTKQREYDNVRSAGENGVFSFAENLTHANIQHKTEQHRFADYDAEHRLGLDFQANNSVLRCLYVLVA
jgi:hypothetical protein